MPPAGPVTYRIKWLGLKGKDRATWTQTVKVPAIGDELVGPDGHTWHVEEATHRGGQYTLVCRRPHRPLSPPGS